MPTSVVFNGTSYNIPLAGELNWSSLSAFLVDVGNNATVATVQKQTIRVALTTPVTVVAASDYAVFSNLTTPGAVAVTLPSGIAGQIFVIGDGKGDAATNNITITPAVAQTINGASTLVLNHNRQVAVLQYHNGSSDWKVQVVSLPPGTVVNADIAAAAAIARTKIASGSANQVIINDGSGVLSSEAQLAGTRGGTGVSSTATYPASGVIVTEAGTETLTNKTLTSPSFGTDASMIAQAPLKFFPPTGTNYIGLEAPNSLSGITTFKLPTADGTSGQVLATDGSANFSFATVATTTLAPHAINIGGAGSAIFPTQLDFLGYLSAKTNTATVTISNASPGVITWTSHGLSVGDSVYFTTTGSLPTGLTASTAYYVAVVLTANTFTVCSTAGETVINTSSAGSGVHTGFSGGLTTRDNVRKPYISVDTGNGTGSTNTGIRRFANVRQPTVNQFSQITYTDSATLGGSFTVNQAGLYYMSYSDRFDSGVGGAISITVNSIVQPQGNTSDVELAIATMPGAGTWACASSMAWLSANDVIRASISTGLTLSTNASVKFRIDRVF